MGQLIKLQDYISRYETDIYRYPGQFIRLKKQQWEKVKDAWEEGTLDTFGAGPTNQEHTEHLEEKPSFLKPLKTLLKRNKQVEEDYFSGEKREPIVEEPEISMSYITRPTSLDELKRAFLEHIFQFQMVWGSSTIREKSYVDKEFFYDENLKYFLQRFPDTYLVLYKPIFLLKKAPVEVDVVIITPRYTYCVTFLESNENSVFIGSNDRFWIERNGDQENKVLTPLIGLNRMERIVRKIYSIYEVDMPIRKVILNRTGFFDYPLVPYDVELVEKRNYENWFSNMRNSSAPLKHIQLKAANALLQYCQTTYVRRGD